MTADQLRRRRWLTVVVMMATIMQALDGTIANVALPNMQGSLSATQEQVAWVITSFIVSAAIATPLAGFLAVRFGVRRILVSSVIGFTIASMMCGGMMQHTHFMPGLEPSCFENIAIYSWVGTNFAAPASQGAIR